MKQLRFGVTPPVPDLVEFTPGDVKPGLKVYDREYGHDATVLGVSGTVVRVEYPVYGADVPEGATDTAAFEMDYIVNCHYVSAAQLEQLRGQEPERPTKGILGICEETAEDNFTARISALMQKNCWGKDMVGEQTGLSEKRLDAVLSGSSLPTLSELVEFSSVFGYSIDELLK